MRRRIGSGFYLALFVVPIVGGLFFARRNLRLGRGDRRNATRLAVFGIGLTAILWILGFHHVLTSWEGIHFIFFTALSLLLGSCLWVLYIAIEPFVRRRWPQILVSWTRMLSGDLRDPLVARDALAGCAGGVFMASIVVPLRGIVPRWLGYPELTPGVTDYTTEGRFFICSVLSNLAFAIAGSLALLCLLFLLRVLLRNDKAAFVAWVLLIPLAQVFILPWINVVINLAAYAVVLFLLMRFGLVALTLVFFVQETFRSNLITLDASVWYKGYGYAALAILAAVVLYAFRTSLAGRPLLASSRLDD